MVGIEIFPVLCLCLPLVIGAPTEDGLKQQIASELFRNEDPSFWAARWSQARNRNAIRRPDSLGGEGFGFQKRADLMSGYGKRNFDEIDRTGFGFMKRNFDEIDRTGFGFNKRNFDEIDRTGMTAFVKRRLLV